MIAAETFEMIETVSAEALERHPVWTPYDPVVDREDLLACGVAGAVLDREYERLEFCGSQPLYPVLRFDPLPDRPHLLLAVRFETPRAGSVPGYLLEPHAFGLFVGGRDFCFNRNLPALARRIGDPLAAALGTAAEQLFPLRFTSALRRRDGARVAGEITRFW